jgi:type II secretory pathway predicted ATPase ExeA
VLIIDEASLLRWEVFAQMHTLSQFDMDSRPLLPMILAGQNNLMDNLMFHTSRPLASRILGKSHLEGLKYKDMAGYLKHHLKIMAEFDYTYPIWIYDVTRTDIGFNAQKAKKLKRQFE